jgi:hypothetical protein
MLEFLTVAVVHVGTVVAADSKRHGAEVCVTRTRNKIGRKESTLFINTTARERAGPEELLVEPGIQSACIHLGRMPLERNTDTN